MTVIDTSTASTASAFSNQRKSFRTETNNVLWKCFWNGASSTTAAMEFHYSTDNGATWTHSSTSDLGFSGTGTTYTPNMSWHPDLDDYAHLVYKDRNDGYIYYRRGTPNAARTAWTWSGATAVVTSASAGPPDLVAHREGTGWNVHIVRSDITGSTAFHAYYYRLTVSSGGSVSVDTVSDLSSNRLAAATADGGNSNYGWPSIDFDHTGDGKTVAGGTPHLYVAWSNGGTGSGYGIRFRKATYSSGSWTWGTEREIDSTRYASSTFFPINCLFDGTRAIIGGMLYDGTNPDIVLYERDAADTTTTTRVLVDNATTAQVLYQGTMTYDGDSNVYFFGRHDNEAAGSNDLVYRKWTRSIATFEAEVVIDSGVGAPWVSAKRGYSSSRIEFIYTDGTASPYNVVYASIALNVAPNAATWVTTDNQPRDVAATLTLDWVFNDPDEGDTQGSYALRRQIGAAAYAYWNAATSTWDASEVQNSSATTELTLAAAWGTDADDNHKYAVKTWDAAGLEGSYSSELTVIPSAKDNPTISSPADAGTVTAATVTVEWSAATQTQYRARLLTSGGSQIETSGWVTSTATSHKFAKSLDNSTSYQVEVTTKNDEGLTSDADTNTFTTSFTPPATPTVAVSESPSGALTVTVTNPGTGAAEESNDVYVRVASGGSADGARPVGGDGARIATGVDVDGSSIDYAVASGVSYEYLVRAIATNSATADSAWTA